MCIYQRAGANAVMQAMVIIYTKVQMQPSKKFVLSVLLVLSINTHLLSCE